MTRKHFSAEEIIGKLREIELLTAKGENVAQAVRTAGITDNTYYRWRKQYGGMKLDEAKRLKDLEKENSRLKKVVADLVLDKEILETALKGKF